MSLPRSKSTPHVTTSRASPLSTHYVAQHTHLRPNIQRHSSAVALNRLATKPFSGYQTPRVEREEDPFSLGGFFPSELITPERQKSEWDWLRVEDGEGEETHEQEVYSGYVSPISEDEECTPCTPGPMFSHGEDEETAKAIKREDKLGILTLKDIFTSTNADEGRTYEPLFSPYSADNPLDHDALYSALCALRQAHTSLSNSEISQTESVSSKGLFSPIDDPESDLAEGNWASYVYQGLSGLLNMLPL